MINNFACSSLLPGTVYGVALNDRRQTAAMAEAFTEAPYKAPPSAAVLYIKPRPCLSFGGAATPVPADLAEVQAAATVAVLFGHDLSHAGPGEVRGAIAVACLALDVSELADSFYRPAIRQQCRDGFLPLGRFAALPEAFDEIVTSVDGKEAHRWSLGELVRPLEALASELSQYMTLQAGDLLLLGLAGDAPRVRPGHTMTVRSQGLPDLSTAFVLEAGQ